MSVDHTEAMNMLLLLLPIYDVIRKHDYSSTCYLKLNWLYLKEVIGRSWIDGSAHKVGGCSQWFRTYVSEKRDEIRLSMRIYDSIMYLGRVIWE